MVRHNQITFYFLILFAITLFEYRVNASEKVPWNKISESTETPSLKFLYCYSCGYRKLFDQYTTIINEKYPYMLVSGYNYDPPGINMFLAKALGMLKLAVILCILGGVNIFDYLNMPAPTWWQWCTENKMYACMMLYFVSNIIEGQLIQSGAFEISLNDVPVWSKLETGRVPQPAELFQIIDSHLQFTNSKFEYNNGMAK